MQQAPAGAATPLSPFHPFDEHIPHIDSSEDSEDDYDMPPSHPPPPPPVEAPLVQQHEIEEETTPAAPKAVERLPPGLLAASPFTLAGAPDVSGQAVVVFEAGSSEGNLSPEQLGLILAFLHNFQHRWRSQDADSAALEPSSGGGGLTLFISKIESAQQLQLLDRAVLAAQELGAVLGRAVLRRQAGGLTKLRRLLPLSKLRLHVVSGEAAALRRFFTDGIPPPGVDPKQRKLWPQLVQEVVEIEEQCLGAEGRLQGAETYQEAIHRLRSAVETLVCPFLRRQVEAAVESLMEGAAEAAARQSRLQLALQQELEWFEEKGEESLLSHAPLSVDQPFQRADFSEAVRHMERASELVEESLGAGGGGGSGGGALVSLARTLKNHLRGFGDKVEDARQKFEDAHRCFYLVQKAEEWASEASRCVEEASDGGPAGGPEAAHAARKQLQLHLMAHPAPGQTQFVEMAQLATKLHNQKLVQQCQEAETMCSSVLGAMRARLAGPQTSPQVDGICGCWAGTKWPEDEDLSDEGKGKEGRSPLTPNAHLQQAELLMPLNTDPTANPATLKTQRTLLLIVREMVQTERDYVRALEYVIENYVPELLREDIPQALRGQRNVIFGNIEKIFEFHSQFFLQELEKCEQRPLSVAHCFLRHETKFYLYALYNKNKPKSDALMAEFGTAFFRTKQLELGDKMDLGSYLLKPVQRMGKYALLLQQMVKAIDGGEGKELDAAESMVRFQLRHGNDLLAMDSLRGYDINLKEQGRLLRQNELLVGEKGKRGLRRRQVFLFEELVVVSKARRLPPDHRSTLDLYIYKSSLKMNDIGLTAHLADAPLKFEVWFRKRRANHTLTLVAPTHEVKDAWTHDISSLLWRQATKNREVRMAEMSSMGIGNKPCLDIRPSEDQISDRSVPMLPGGGSRLRRTGVAERRRRPHSVVSVCSSSSSSAGSNYGSAENSTLRSNTLNSHSSLESGIISDLSASLEETALGAWEPPPLP